MAFGMVVTGATTRRPLDYQVIPVYDGAMTSEEEWSATGEALSNEAEWWLSGIHPKILHDVFTSTVDVDRYDVDRYNQALLAVNAPCRPTPKAPEIQQAPAVEYVHYAIPQRGAPHLLRLVAQGGPIITACGQSWTPKDMPQMGDPICPECAAIHDAGQTDLLWIRRGQPDL